MGDVVRMSDKILSSLEDVLEWVTGNDKRRVTLPDGTTGFMTFDEYTLAYRRYLEAQRREILP